MSAATSDVLPCPTVVSPGLIKQRLRALSLQELSEIVSLLIRRVPAYPSGSAMERVVIKELRANPSFSMGDGTPIGTSFLFNQGDDGTVRRVRRTGLYPTTLPHFIQWFHAAVRHLGAEVGTLLDREALASYDKHRASVYDMMDRRIAQYFAPCMQRDGDLGDPISKDDLYKTLGRVFESSAAERVPIKIIYKDHGDQQKEFCFFVDQLHKSLRCSEGAIATTINLADFLALLPVTKIGQNSDKMKEIGISDSARVLGNAESIMQKLMCVRNAVLDSARKALEKSSLPESEKSCVLEALENKFRVPEAELEMLANVSPEVIAQMRDSASKKMYMDGLAPLFAAYAAPAHSR